MTMIVSLECHALIILHRCRERCEGAAASASTSSPHGHSSASAIALASAFISIRARIPDEVSLSGHTVKPWWSYSFSNPACPCARAQAVYSRAWHRCSALRAAGERAIREPEQQRCATPPPSGRLRSVLTAVHLVPQVGRSVHGAANPCACGSHPLAQRHGMRMVALAM